MLLYLSTDIHQWTGTGIILGLLPIERILAVGTLALRERDWGTQLELFEPPVQQSCEFPRRGRRDRIRSSVLGHPHRATRSILVSVVSECTRNSEMGRTNIGSSLSTARCCTLLMKKSCWFTYTWTQEAPPLKSWSVCAQC